MRSPRIIRAIPLTISKHQTYNPFHWRCVTAEKNRQRNASPAQETSSTFARPLKVRLPGQSGTARTVKSDFKTIEGIPFAFQSKTYVKDKVVMETTTKQIKVNPEIDLSLFKIEEEKK